MIDLPDGFADAINEVFRKYNIENIRKADILGQASLELEGCHLGNTYPWLTGGMLYRYATKHNAVKTLKQLSELLITKQKNAHLNYNDMDCDLTARHLITPIECLTCSAFVTRIDKNKPETKDCPRCKGTGKDPEYNEYSWIVLYENHGYTTFYIIHENIGKIELHIRELPYNSKKSDIRKMFDELDEAIQKDCYDTECTLLRYRDTRDDGFILSMEYDKPDKVSKFPISHKCEVRNARAVYAIETIVEHFPCVMEDLIKEEFSH